VHTLARAIFKYMVRNYKHGSAQAFKGERIMPSDCSVCNHPKSFELMTKVFQGKMNYIDAAREMNLPYQTVWKCFTSHWETISDEEGLKIQLKKATEAGDFVTILRKNIELFINRLDQAKTMPVSSYNEGAVTKLSSELRGIMRDILEFEGKLKTGTIIQLNIMQVQMTKLTEFLLSNLCEEDKQKLIIALPQIIAESSATVQGR
jgi:hypothetical protein